MTKKEEVCYQIRTMGELCDLDFIKDDKFVEYVYNQKLDGFSGYILKELYEKYKENDNNITQKVKKSNIV